ncbi:hypothetical protein MMPV_002538 [Pyropia vietnamensis]
MAAASGSPPPSPPSLPPLPRLSVAIDRGGTFTDVFAQLERSPPPGAPPDTPPAVETVVLKLLSVDPTAYADAPLEAIRRLLGRLTGAPLPVGAPLPTRHLRSVRMATTVATNALLERAGTPTVLVLTAGLGGVLAIGSQARPALFDLSAARPPPLYTAIVEATERVVLTGPDRQTPTVEVPLDEAALRADLRRLHADHGYVSVAVALAHSYAFRDHEAAAARIAAEEGYTHVTTSAAAMPTVGLVARATTAVVDAYLTPAIRGYVAGFRAGFTDPSLEGVDVQFMQSDGGLCTVDAFRAFRAVLSGPAAGVVGYGRAAARQHELQRRVVEAAAAAPSSGAGRGDTAAATRGGKPLVPPPPPPAVIGVDMGGTSTDVSRYAGDLELVFEATVAGARLAAPQLDILTVAAGGGSALSLRAGLLAVGPESVGAHPGPAAYRKGGGGAVTDANVVLGRVLPAHFPAIFGPTADQPLDVAASRAAVGRLTDELNAFYAAEAEAAAAERGEDGLKAPPPPPRVLSLEETALGFIAVANEAMCRPIRSLTEAKGHDVRRHELAVFGGAGGQHAVALARSLGVTTVRLHRYAGLLSAYGLALADSVVEVQSSLGGHLGDDGAADGVAMDALASLEAAARAELGRRRVAPEAVRVSRYLHLRYEGTDFGLMVDEADAAAAATAAAAGAAGGGGPSHDYAAAFATAYEAEHGFTLRGRALVMDDARVRAVGAAATVLAAASATAEPSGVPGGGDDGGSGGVVDAPVAETTRCYFDGPGWVDDTSVVKASSLVPGARIRGPAIVVDPSAGATVVIEPGCAATVEADGDLVVSVPREVADREEGPLDGSPTTVADGGDVPPSVDGGGATRSATAAMVAAAVGGGGPGDPPPDPVRLSIFGHRFMSIAEQCGRVLQRTAISVNIKERLDFSVALFDATGGLVANAPHVPVHLGSMQAAVRYQVDRLGDAWAPGDVLLANHPSAGGTHLPDVTVITPVYRDGVPVFYVASRGHQTDVGGATPGSMPPFSTTLAEEGMAVESMKLVEGGVFHEDRLVAALSSAGCRCVRDVLSDIKAQVAANNKGVTLVGDLIAAEGLWVVLSYMRHIQTAASAAVRSMLRRVSLDAGLPPVGTLRATDSMDDGSVLAVAVTIDRAAGSGVVDFTGTSPAVAGNTNAPPAIAASAVIYTLRCLVDLDIPLNQGCLAPITLRLPPGSLLSPPASAAVVGGNVLTSQRVTDVLLRAFGAAAASQGCMNNLTFGSANTSYYETIAGGAGAGRSWDGESGVHTHMTNTRITDAEVLERRYPVVLREWALRPGSGGRGAHKGGSGVVRTLEFRAPLTVSILSERREISPWGASGGGDGVRGENWLSRGGGSLLRLGGKATVEVVAGDRLRICTPGGGGWGVPRN